MRPFDSGMPASLWTLPGLLPIPGWPPAPPVGPCLHGFRAGAVAVHALVLPGDPEPWIARLEATASEVRREAAARFRLRADQLRCLAGEALLGHALGELHGLDGTTLRWERDPGGKPRLASHPAVHFNLSHSGPWVLCAVHEGPVGIDVEEDWATDPLPAATIMSPEEFQHYASLPATARRTFFFRLWTLKESFLKALGTGLGVDPRTFSPDLEDEGGTVVCPSLSPARWRVRELPMPPGVHAAICSLEEEPPLGTS